MSLRKLGNRKLMSYISSPSSMLMFQISSPLVNLIKVFLAMFLLFVVDAGTQFPSLFATLSDRTNVLSAEVHVFLILFLAFFEPVKLLLFLDDRKSSSIPINQALVSDSAWLSSSIYCESCCCSLGNTMVRVSS